MCSRKSRLAKRHILKVCLTTEYNTWWIYFFARHVMHWDTTMCLNGDMSQNCLHMTCLSMCLQSNIYFGRHDGYTSLRDMSCIETRQCVLLKTVSQNCLHRTCLSMCLQSNIYFWKTCLYARHDYKWSPRHHLTVYHVGL